MAGVRPRDVAVFIDAENLLGWVDAAALMASVRDEARAVGGGSIALARAYADWRPGAPTELREALELERVETRQVHPVASGGKNAADIEIVVDALRAADELPNVRVFVLASGDGDFIPLVRRLHELGKEVVGVGMNGRTNPRLRGATDHFAELSEPTPADLYLRGLARLLADPTFRTVLDAVVAGGGDLARIGQLVRARDATLVVRGTGLGTFSKAFARVLPGTPYRLVVDARTHKTVLARGA